MEYIELKDLADIICGFPFKSECFNTEGEGIRLVRGMNVSKRKIRWGDDTRWWNDFSVDLSYYQLKKDDIVIGMDGSLVGKNYAKIRTEDLPSLLVQRVACIRAKKEVSQDFLWHCISNSTFEKYIESIKTGTTIPHISQKQISQYQIPKLSYESQQKIATILSSLDDKIELNNKINENLEQQAQALFKSWFSDNDSNLTEIEIGKLDILITDYVANGSFKDLADNVKYLTEETNNVLIRLTDYNNNFSSDMVYISDESYDFLEKSKLYGDEIIISNVGANVGTVFRCPRLSKRMSLAPNSIMIRANNYEHYLYLFFTSAYGQGLLKSIVTGSAQPKFNKTNFRSLKIKIPNEEQLSKFNNIYNSIHEKIINNQKENMNLASIRDSLLPKLMNGEIDLRVDI